jgi:hypothetical protein
MNYDELKKWAAPGPLWRDDDGFLASGSGDDYVTVADCDCNDRDINEREATKALIAHRYNHFDEVVEALEAITQTYRTFRNVPNEDKEWTPIDDEALDNAFSVLARAKEVK